MKDTGIVKQIDELGRIVIPKEVRRTYGIADRDYLEMYTEGDCIILKKHCPYCAFCGSDEDIAVFKEKHICASCMLGIAQSTLKSC